MNKHGLSRLLAMFAMTGTAPRKQTVPSYTAMKAANDHIKARNDRSLPPGVKRWEYPDGFTCIAINKKNADRKRSNYIRSQNSPL